MLEHPEEKDGMRKRRILIAKRFGLITGDQAITKQMWQKDIIGRQIIVTTELQTWKDKFDVEKSAVKVAFSGYESADNAQASTDNFEDI